MLNLASSLGSVARTMGSLDGYLSNQCCAASVEYFFGHSLDSSRSLI
jgi:hypothetical protein